ncbi:hypothetical protein SDC9_145092 [bioreactor metagenome]|uniref:Uncharacterized protein n=1 Tax=bioreactor metagenome TaxID=1076179 RepID=A0A645EB76_9ZZZZ
MIREEQRNRTDAAVRIHNRFLRLGVKEFRRGFIQYCRLHTVDLQKALRADGEALFADSFGQNGFAGEQRKALSEHDVGILGVFVVPNTVAPFQIRKQLVGSLERAARDHDNHQLTVRRGAGNNVSELAFAGRFVIHGHAAVVRPGGDFTRGFHNLLVLNGAVGKRDQPVAALGVKAEHRGAVHRAERKTPLVAVADGFVHADDLPNGNGRKAAKAGERVADPLLLLLQLRGVRKVP